MCIRDRRHSEYHHLINLVFGPLLFSGLLPVFNSGVGVPFVDRQFTFIVRVLCHVSPTNMNRVSVLIKTNFTGLSLEDKIKVLKN